MENGKLKVENERRSLLLAYHHFQFSTLNFQLIHITIILFEMRKFFTLVFVSFLLAGNSIYAQKKVELKTLSDSLSYAYGIMIGHSMNEADADAEIKQLFNADFIGLGLGSVLKNEETIMSIEEAGMYFQEYMYAAMEREAKKKFQAEEDFFAANAKQPGIKTTESGLQYKVITEGTGKRVEASNDVELHYSGTLIDGTVFDSSVERGEKVVFPANRLIDGFNEGLQLMSEGAKYILYIPSNLAYGERGAGEIPPYSPLIFEVEVFTVMEGEEYPDFDFEY